MSSFDQTNKVGNSEIEKIKSSLMFGAIKINPAIFDGPNFFQLTMIMMMMMMMMMMVINIHFLI